MRERGRFSTAIPQHAAERKPFAGIPGGWTGKKRPLSPRQACRMVSVPREPELLLLISGEIGTNQFRLCHERCLPVRQPVTMRSSRACQAAVWASRSLEARLDGRRCPIGRCSIRSYSSMVGSAVSQGLHRTRLSVKIRCTCRALAAGENLKKSFAGSTAHSSPSTSKYRKTNPFPRSAAASRCATASRLPPASQTTGSAP